MAVIKKLHKMRTPLVLTMAAACCVFGLQSSVSSMISVLKPPAGVFVDFAGTDYVALVQTKTRPPFYISLHREKDDTPRAPIMYTGLYYESGKTSELRELLSMSDGRMQGTFLDVGANIGWFTLYAAALGRQVVAFEPNPTNVLRLKQSIQANNFGDRVIVKPYGAGPSSNILKFRQRATNFGMGTFVHNLTDGADGVIEIHVRRVDDELMDVPRRWRQRVAVVKIDVEGFEAGVLEGMLETLRNDKPLVYIEFNNERPSSNRYYESVWAFLQLGYRLQTSPNSKAATTTAAGAGTAALMGTSFAELRGWFDTVVHAGPTPSDYLFLPKWLSDEDLPH